MCVRASDKEDSQRTTTLTDNKKRDHENVGSSMHEDSCIGIYCAHMFSTCFRSLHTMLGFALYIVSSILNIVAVIYSILTCTRIPCRGYFENGSFELSSLHTSSRPLQQTVVSCERSNCNNMENNKKQIRESRSEVLSKDGTQRVSPFCHVALCLSSHELHQESFHCHFVGCTKCIFWDTTFREGGAYFG